MVLSGYQVIRVVSKHANFSLYRLIADINPHQKHESTPRQTHRQRTSVSPIAYQEASCQFGVEKSVQ